MNCKVIHRGTETKNLGEKRKDVLHLEGVEDEHGPGHGLTIQLTCANDTGYVSLVVLCSTFSLEAGRYL